MKEVAIVCALRTPIGSFRGAGVRRQPTTVRPAARSAAYR